MNDRLFSIPVAQPGDAQDEMNRFIALVPRPRDCETIRAQGGAAATGSGGILPARRRQAVI